MEQFLREWRRDALSKNQYDAAIFIGDKLLALTSMGILFVSDPSLYKLMSSCIRQYQRRMVASTGPLLQGQLRTSAVVHRTSRLLGLEPAMSMPVRVMLHKARQIR
jgi:hypothetical protein